MYLRALTRRLLAPAAITALLACSGREPEFEVLGIRIDSTTLEAARQMHPSLDCDEPIGRALRPLIPDYKDCRVKNVEVAKIRSSLKLHVNKAGVVTAITIHGEPYDGPIFNWSKAMTNKYGAATGEESGNPVWKGSNGETTLAKTENGGAMLV